MKSASLVFFLLVGHHTKTHSVNFRTVVIRFLIAFLLQVRMQNQTGGALYKGTLDCVTKTVKNEVSDLSVSESMQHVSLFIRTKLMKTQISKSFIYWVSSYSVPLNLLPLGSP